MRRYEVVQPIRPEDLTEDHPRRHELRILQDVIQADGIVAAYAGTGSCEISDGSPDVGGADHALVDSLVCDHVAPSNERNADALLEYRAFAMSSILHRPTHIGGLKEVAGCAVVREDQDGGRRCFAAETVDQLTNLVVGALDEPFESEPTAARVAQVVPWGITQTQDLGLRLRAQALERRYLVIGVWSGERNLDEKRLARPGDPLRELSREGRLERRS